MLESFITKVALAHKHTLLLKVFHMAYDGHFLVGQKARMHDLGQKLCLTTYGELGGELCLRLFIPVLLIETDAPD